jgi:AAA+ superfamily predicted ATPase
VCWRSRIWSLITPHNRSYFLNEFDGFAENDGILTLATTNHPERLDPAILDRPSRFDRKHPFDLPAVEERSAYIELWNATLRPALRLSEEGVTQVAERTDGFSFAYLKELFLSAMMRWISSARGEAMDGVMLEQVEVLRGHMASVAELPSDPGYGTHLAPPHPGRGFGASYPPGPMFQQVNPNDIPL